MPTIFYLTNREKKEEILSFNRFWEEYLIPGLKAQIKGYCEEISGEYVNTDFAERIINDIISSISSTPKNPSSYETEIGVSRWNGKRVLFLWEGAYIKDKIIRDETSLVDFFKIRANQERYCIVDEHDVEYTIDSFLNKINYTEY